MLSLALTSGVVIADDASWGVADSTFLVTYAVVGVVAVMAAQVWRLLIIGVDPRSEEPRVLTGVEIAMIEAGPAQVVVAATTDLRSRGLLGPDDRATRRATVDDELPEITLAVHEFIRDHDGIPSDYAVYADPQVQRRIRRMRLDLAARGLLITESRRRRIMWSVTPVVILELVGTLRLTAALAAGRGIGGLLMVMILLLAVALGILLTIPHQTPAGQQATRALRDQ